MGKNISHIIYHLLVILLSAAVAMSMPFLLSAMAQNLLEFWALVENEKIFMVTIEIGTAIAFILLVNGVRCCWQNRRLAGMAKSAGLIQSTPSRGFLVHGYKARSKSMKNRQGFAREIMIIGATGCGSFARPEGDLYEAVRNCREAKIMLLDPRKHGASARAKSIPDPEITPETIREQIVKSIRFIKELRAFHKTVRLKLYPDMPLFKMAILGDFAYVRHYHTGLNVRYMPEFAFENIQQDGGLFMPLYRYFLSRWKDPDIPEYDLETDELVYHDHQGYEVRREPFNCLDLDAGTEEIRTTEEVPAAEDTPIAEEVLRLRYVFH